MKKGKNYAKTKLSRPLAAGIACHKWRACLQANQ